MTKYRGAAGRSADRWDTAQDEGWPSFRELPVRQGTPSGASWGVFGDAGDVGTLNFIGHRQVRGATESICEGKVFSLNWNVMQPNPGLFYRRSPRHRRFHVMEGTVLDDALDDFFLQSSSQWDALKHYGDSKFGFYEGVTLATLMQQGEGRLGVQHIAQRGIACRGVVVDIARACRRSGTRYDPLDFFPITVDLLQGTLLDEGVELKTGDMLLIRTGWIESYSKLSVEKRQALSESGSPGAAGLYGDEIPEFLWDKRISAVIADNTEVEASHPGSGSGLILHKALIARLGMPLGELWDLTALAEECHRDGRFTVFLASAPMNLLGGAGSPANAIAIK